MKILEVKDLNKIYPSFRLNNVSFTLEEGSIMGFIGRNGAGKTTTLKAIMNLIHKNSGEVKIEGKDFIENENVLKGNIGFLLAEHDYYTKKKIKIISNVTKRFYKDWDDDKYHYYLKFFNIDENKAIKDLSNGMKVKYQLAIALSHNAKLLILDEPTSGLDPISRDEILEIFKKIVKDKKHAILFSTHITSDLDKCADAITYIHNGSIVASETKNDFLETYLLVSGSENDLNDKLKNHFISYRIEDGKFAGMIKKLEYEEDDKLTTKLPNIEEIMIYTERSKEDEEFII